MWVWWCWAQLYNTFADSQLPCCRSKPNCHVVFAWQCRRWEQGNPLQVQSPSKTSTSKWSSLLSSVGLPEVCEMLCSLTSSFATLSCACSACRGVPPGAEFTGYFQRSCPCLWVVTIVSKCCLQTTCHQKYRQTWMWASPETTALWQAQLSYPGSSPSPYSKKVLKSVRLDLPGL